MAKNQTFGDFDRISCQEIAGIPETERPWPSNAKLALIMGNVEYGT